MLEFRNVLECDIEAAAIMCARAFLDSPSYVDIYRGGGDASWRLAELQWLFSTHFRVIHAKNPSALRGGYDGEPSTLVCFFMFIPSNMPSISLMDKLYAGFFALPFRVGWNVYSQLTATSDHFDKAFHDMIPDRPCIDVYRMAVSPEHQGKGIGSKCLGNIVRHIIYG
jgi:GNAT superfamily N-acetyltransferase